MKVLHIEAGRHLYGGALQVSYLLNQLPSQGVDCHLLCPPDAAIAEACPPSVGVSAVPLSGDVDLLAISRIAKVIRRVEPDVVHCHSRRGADVFGGLAAKLTGVPCVLSRRVDNPEPRWLVPVKYGLFDQVITISQGISSVLETCGVDPAKITCVRSAVDVEAFAQPAERAWFSATFQLPEDALVLGMAAQMIERKGHHTLFAALPPLLDAYPNLHVLILGKGPLEAEIQARAAAAPYAGRVHVAGFRTDMPRILPNLYALVHPATAEGLGIALLQAASAGIPVVSCPVGGIPEAVLDGETGLLCTPDDPAELRSALTRLLSDPAGASRMGAAGQQRMYAEFSIATMAEGNAAVYRKVLGQTL